MEKLIKFIVIDDHQLFADGLARILLEEGRFSLEAIYNSVHEVKEISADLILLDIQLMGKSGLDLCAQLRAEYPELKIILISMLQAPHIIKESEMRGANGFIPKTTDAELLKETVIKVCKGEKAFIGIHQKESNPHRTQLLSDREMQIVHLIRKGLTSRSIAEELFLSEFTVETHRKNILKKLRLNTASELIAFAYENHL